ncbi:MAG: hypothetical protein JST92_05700 [Deltaproteobacteria bacterium]|nr:hypothetical protein [Deltaproteobacteria bacterium]
MSRASATVAKTRRAAAIAAAVWLAGALAACSAAPRGGAGGQGEAGDGTGTEEGDVLPALSWDGYLVSDASAATDSADAKFTTGALASSGARLAVLHFSEYSEVGSRHGAVDLSAAGADLSAAGGIAAEILVSRSGSEPNGNELREWAWGLQLHITTLRDAADAPGATWAAVGITEVALVVELPSMKILARYEGRPGGNGPSSAAQAIPDALARLRQ